MDRRGFLGLLGRTAAGVALATVVPDLDALEPARRYWFGHRFEQLASPGAVVVIGNPARSRARDGLLWGTLIDYNPNPGLIDYGRPLGGPSYNIGPLPPITLSFANGRPPFSKADTLARLTRDIEAAAERARHDSALWVHDGQQWRLA